MMRVAVHFKSTEAAVGQLNEMVQQLEKGEDGYLLVPVEDADVPVEELRLEFINEGNDEFAQPSATVKARD